MLVSDWKGSSGPGLAFWTISAVDEIDRVLASHYGFTEEELDLIPSTKLRAGDYDIKYRMGREAEADDE